ncbi:amidohydrolase family-domain-containing protein [Xylariomycetidae sp. FL0641]|nr:amidohydrolase family-domain-containing protein [Xylariomycetidae sp. FL0641]
MPGFGRDTRWLYFSAVIAALVAVVKYRQGAIDYLYSETHCYKSIRTNRADDVDSPVNCFSVSPSGKFTKVFQADSTSDLAQTADPGYAMPGLWDGHGHLLQYGEFLNSVDLFGSQSMEEVRSRIHSYVSRHPDAGSKDDWIRGIGWDQMALGKMPTAHDLTVDDKLGGKYVMLDRVDVHCIWVSQAVLDLLPGSIPDVPGGEVVRDPGMGVFCDNAMDMVTALFPKPDKKQKQKFLKSAMTKLNEVGLVGMHDAGVTPRNLKLFRELAGNEDWTLRVYAMAECDERNTFCPDEVEQYTSPDDFLGIQSVKLFADGALGSWGSALLEPYNDRPETSGSLLVNASALTDQAVQWAQAGFQVNIHAIGDLANRLALDAHAAALAAVCPSSSSCTDAHRFRIEHAQIIHPADQARMRRPGLRSVPSVQPTHATSDMAYAEARLGAERTRTEAYRMRSLLEDGGGGGGSGGLPLVLGSDFPVEPPNPFQGIYAAVTRRSPHTGRGRDGADQGWYAEEALSLDQAVRGFTLGPAYAAFMEDRAGVISEGALADWVVLDRPLEEMDVEELRGLRVRETWVGGRRVYARKEA